MLDRFPAKRHGVRITLQPLLHSLKRLLLEVACHPTSAQAPQADVVYPCRARLSTCQKRALQPLSCLRGEHALQTGTVDDRDVLLLHLDQPFLLEAGEQPAHGLELEPEVAADVLA